MELSTAAIWLNTAFSGYDSAILSIMHTLADKVGVVLTPLMRLITLLGEKGLIFFLVALMFLCFSKERKMGVCLFGALCCGALITNVILKDAVARARPFEAVEAFNQWWSAVGAPAEDGFSFPSGHVTAAAAGVTALCLMRGKKLILPSVIWVFLMAVSRNYLMAHYPSDVLFAAIIGCASGFIAFYITKIIYRLLESNDDVPFCALVLGYDVPVPVFGDVVGKLDRVLISAGGENDGAVKPSRSKPAKGSEGSSSVRSGGHSGNGAVSKSNRGYKGKHEV